MKINLRDIIILAIIGIGGYFAYSIYKGLKAPIEAIGSITQPITQGLTEFQGSRKATEKMVENLPKGFIQPITESVKIATIDIPTSIITGRAFKKPTSTIAYYPPKTISPAFVRVASKSFIGRKALISLQAQGYKPRDKQYYAKKKITFGGKY